MIEQFVEDIIKENPLQQEFLDRSVESMNSKEIESLTRLLKAYTQQGMTSENLASAYNVIVLDTLKEQLYFRKNKKYRYSKFSEVADEVYFSPEYMKSYMVGLALSQYLWPNHRQLRRFFQKSIADQQGDTYMEVGPGHGLQLVDAINSKNWNQYRAVDISETSLELTKETLGVFEIAHENTEFIQSDFLKDQLNTTIDAFVMGEVLEHVESPQSFMERIKSITNESSFIFLTTCANAPAIDHIYLFNSDNEILQLAADHGFSLLDHLSVPYEGLTLEQCRERALPINVAMVLKNDK